MMLHLLVLFFGLLTYACDPYSDENCQFYSKIFGNSGCAEVGLNTECQTAVIEFQETERGSNLTCAQCAQELVWDIIPCPQVEEKEWCEHPIHGGIRCDTQQYSCPENEAAESTVTLYYFCRVGERRSLLDVDYPLDDTFQLFDSSSNTETGSALERLVDSEEV